MLSIITLPSGMDEWKQSLLLLPESCQDTYFTPEYLLMHAEIHRGSSICLKYIENSQVWLFPILCTPIEKIGKVNLPSGLYDLETAYGYGGPLCNTEDQGFIKRATNASIEWAENYGVVAHFTCFHPLLQNERWVDDPELEILFDRYTASTDLQKYSKDKDFYPKSTRNIISRGQRAGLSVKFIDIDENFSSFVGLYQKTMHRLGADPFYRFDDQYFTALQMLIIKNGYLCAAFHSAKMVAAAIFFYGTRLIHYHLSASDFDYRLPGTMNLILDRAIAEGQARGFSRLHLGGGRTVATDDSLFKFKKSMATDIHSFNIGKRIYNKEVYNNLKTIWKQEYPNLISKYQHRLLCYRYQDG